MRTWYNRISCIALLTVILLLTAAGCAAERPAAGGQDQIAHEPATDGQDQIAHEPDDDGQDQIAHEPDAETGRPGQEDGGESGVIGGIGGVIAITGDDTGDGTSNEGTDSAPASGPSAELAGGPVSLTAGTAIKEGEEPVLTVSLTGLEFVDGEAFSPSAFTLHDLPDGLDFVVERGESGTAAEITLSGTPAGAVEDAAVSLTIEKSQFRPQPDQDVPVVGSVSIVVAAGSGLPASPAVLAACAAAAAVLIAAIITLFLKKKKNAGKRQAPPAAKAGKAENIRRETERRDMPNQTNQPNAAPLQNAPSDTQGPSGTVQIGKLHNIGRRPAQQDSLGSMSLDGGSDVFAVVADGMGGLSGGDQISQGVVMSMLQQAGSLGPGQMNGELNTMVRKANEEINRRLGPNGIYRSGSTVVAVLLRGNVFHWIAVGDSRIYLYRGGSMIQLNQEHTYAAELMQRVMNGEITAAEAANDPQRHGLTSFIGMGRLKYVDASMRPIMLQSGDRILLMTDGVFNNLPESAMADTLRRNPDVQQAAKVLEEQVLALQDPAQDNFTAIVLGFQG